MARYSLPFVLALLSALPESLAWGDVGHETIAYIAQSFVTSDTATYCQNILGDTSDSYLANAATWADTYKYTSSGEWSKPLHFIDALDSPPDSCGVKYSRDCGSEGCVVSAINNYTERVQKYTGTQQLDAMNFIIHFIGDIHQPLHDENLDYGGNDIDVTFDGTSTNLHHIWDTNMIEYYTGSSSESSAETFSKELVADIKSGGSYASEASSWLDDLDFSDPITTATGWAESSNAYVCSTVMPDGISAVENTDLDGDYYDTALPVIKLQLARGEHGVL
ncbi:MAG: hypothetical protein M1819_002508 [Sarea resinae]|nr:MAG: hypothetical protein M1819_002508 [Sarea resinae]